MTYPPYPGPIEPRDPHAPDPYAAQPSPRYATPQPPAGPAGLPRAATSAHGLMVAAAITAGILTVTEIVEAALAWPAQNSYLDAADRGTSAADVWTPYDFMVIPWSIALLASFIVTCLWLGKVRTNAEVLWPGAHHSHGTGWVWGGWLTPVVSLWFPYQVVRDVADAPGRVRRSLPLGAWWTFFLLTQLASEVAGGFESTDEIDKGLTRAMGPAETVDAVITLVALVLWLRVLRGITTQQDSDMGPAA